MARTINSFVKKLSRLEASVSRSKDLSSVLADKLAAEVVKNLPELGDDYAHGGGNEVGNVFTKVTSKQATVRWAGDQVWYLEFGTGAPAVGKYPDSSTMGDANYSPRPEGHSLGQYWVLPMDEYSTSDGKPVVTKGWAPYAPFFNAMTAYNGGKFNKELSDALRKRIEAAL